MGRIIVHVDLNQFFVRCEELKNPSLVGKPVIIGRNGRGGIVSTCSYAARSYGVSSGMPTFKAKKLCPNAILIHEDFSYYHQKSHEFFDFLKRYTNQIEVASIDECYLDFTSNLKECADPYNYLLNLQLTLKKQTGLNCSMGVSFTKFLAKMGSDLLKPNGITFITKENIEEKLYKLPVGDFFGVGKKSAPRLNQIGIYTIEGLANVIKKGPAEGKKKLGNFYYYAKDCLEGKTSDQISTEEFDPQSLGHSTTLLVDCSSYDEISAPLRNLSTMVAKRVKEYKKKGQTVNLVVKDTGFKLHTKSVSLKEPTDDGSLIFETTSKLYKENYEGLNIRLIGVSLSRLINIKDDLDVAQMTLFNYEKVEKASKTNKLLETLNAKLKSPLLMRASDVKRKKN